MSETGLGVNIVVFPANVHDLRRVSGSVASLTSLLFYEVYSSLAQDMVVNAFHCLYCRERCRHTIWPGRCIVDNACTRYPAPSSFSSRGSQLGAYVRRLGVRVRTVRASLRDAAVVDTIFIRVLTSIPQCLTTWVSARYVLDNTYVCSAFLRSSSPPQPHGL